MSASPPAGFAPLKNRSPWVKLVAFGGMSSGKTNALARIAIGLWKEAKLEAPVGFLDPEHALALLQNESGVNPFEASGVPVLVQETNKPAALKEALEAARKREFSILVVDGYGHFRQAFETEWAREHGIKNRPLSAPERGDLNVEWGALVDEHLRDDPCHYLVAGRAGDRYESVWDPETGRFENHNVGEKLAKGGSATFEGNLVLRLERRELLGSGKLKVFRVAVVEKDRTGAVDGRVLNESGVLAGPEYAELAPAIKRVLANAAPAIPSRPLPPVVAGQSTALKDRELAVRKALLLDEIKGFVGEAFVGSGKDVDAARRKAIGDVFGTSPEAYLGFASGVEVEKLEIFHEKLDAIVTERLGYAPRSLARDSRKAYVSGARAPEPEKPKSVSESLGVSEDVFDLSPRSGGGSAPDPMGAAPALLSGNQAQVGPQPEKSPQAAPSPHAQAGVLPASPEASVRPSGASSQATGETREGASAPLPRQNAESSSSSPAADSSTGSGAPGVPETHDAAPAPESPEGQSGPKGVASSDVATFNLTVGFLCPRCGGDAFGVSGATGPVEDQKVNCHIKTLTGSGGCGWYDSYLSFFSGDPDPDGERREPGPDEPLSPEMERACQEAEAAPMPQENNKAPGSSPSVAAGEGTTEFEAAGSGETAPVAPAGTNKACPLGECDGSGWTTKTGEKCLCKTGVEPPKPTPSGLSFEEARSRLGTFTKNADALLRDVLAGEPSSVSPGLAKRVLDLAEKKHSKQEVDAAFEAVGGRLSKPGPDGERKRLGLAKVSRGQLRGLLARLSIIDSAQGRQNPEKDDEEKSPTVPRASQEAHSW